MIIEPQDKHRPDQATPRVALVVTCYNDGATLGETIGSIRADDGEAIELVVVDDGSTDEPTLQLLAGLEREGTRVIHQTNQGQAAAATAGARATSAQYIMRFDADDLLERGAVTELADALDETVDAAAAWGDIKTFGLTNLVIPSPHTLDAWLVTYTNCFPASSLFRRTALDGAGYWHLREGFEDWDLWLSLAERGWSAVHVRRIGYRYRRDRGGQLSRWHAETGRYYDELRRRHEPLFAARATNRQHSSAPRFLLIALPIIDALPFGSRLWKIHLSELLVRFWAGGARLTMLMVWQAGIARFRRG